MKNYIDGVIKDFPEVIVKTSLTPAADHLFDVHSEEERKELGKEKAIIFHHTMAQLLFLSTRSRRDIQTTVAFLTT